MLDNLYLFFILVLILGALTVLYFIKAIINRYQQKKLARAIREFDTRVKQDWEKKNAELSLQKAERDKKIADETEAQRKKDAEAIKKMEITFADFFDSPENKFIERFAEKFADDLQQDELNKLQLLLKTRNWDFSFEELKLLVAREVRKQDLEKFYSNIANNQPEERLEIMKYFLDNYSPDDQEMLESLATSLRDKNLFNGTTANLKTEIIQLKEKIIADDFAKLLLNEN